MNGIRRDDPGLAIKWPVQEPGLSKKDADYPFFSQQAQEGVAKVLAG